MRLTITLIGVLLFQIACTLIVISDILSSFISIRSTPVSWQARELMEVGAAAGLVVGVVLGAVLLARSHRRTMRVEAQLRVASGAFMELLAERFDEWGLTAAERDVTVFALKGLTVPEIARVRDTSEGTVKAQTNAIYRKAGVNGRPQLLGLFIGDLMGETLLQRPAAEKPGGGAAGQPRA